MVCVELYVAVLFLVVLPIAVLWCVYQLWVVSAMLVRLERGSL